MNLMQIFRQFFTDFKTPRLRDRRGHYASTIMSDLRDQYWALTGEPETNPADHVGRVKMWIGTALEHGLMNEIIRHLHFFGLHLLGTQVPAGGTDPAFDMYFDGVAIHKVGDKWGKKYVLEVKSKSGYGADILMRDFNPGEDYMAQMGLYLEDASKKGLTNEGIFIFIPLSDRSIGDLVAVYCRYDAQEREVIAYKAQTLSGMEKELDIHFNVLIPKKRAQYLDKAVAKKEVPPCEFPYKDPLTPEYLAKVSDAQLEKAMNGEVILGSWRPKYSRYKDKILQVDNVKPEYSPEEIAILKAEFKRRHPRSKKVA